ncbi:MAG TPA: L-histidine N(alpha)-methyltransferase [Gemmatirosa sp.]|nr:L-histidine N(alpha)-methyltransferase [Gemmatirosa sp.]
MPSALSASTFRDPSLGDHTSPDRLRARAQRRGIRRDVLAGLQATPKTLPPKLFYDDAGAALFERICALPEYYVTRAELEILEACSRELAGHLGPRVVLVEYGSGAGVKVRLLLDALDAAAAYVPVDISASQLRCVADEIQAAYPALDVRPVCADFTRPLTLPTLAPGGRPVAFFPGSTLGNFHPPDAAAFLRRIARTVGRHGALVVGLDRRKAAATLEAAYDDAQGVTAAFNRNLLARINRELAADFDLAAFEHRAVWNAAESRIEMHLESGRTQAVRVAGRRIAFAAGERIWTECSYKYDDRSLAALAAASGLTVERRWTDADDRFWVLLLRVL